MKKILLVLSDAAANEAAIARLGALADEGAEVEALAIVHEPHLDGYLGNTEIYAPLRKRLLDEEQERTGTIVGQIEAAGFSAQVKVVWDWPRGDAIRRHAFSAGADAIVVSFGLGSHRDFGSADWRFLAECPLPILVVNQTAAEPYRHVIAAVDPVHAHAKPEQLDHVIAGLAGEIGARTGAKLDIVHFYTPLSHYGARSDGDEAVPLNDAEQKLEAVRQKALDALAAEAGSAAGQARLIEGNAARGIEALIEDEAADLVVMGALARGRLAEFFIGSTAERLLHRGKSDILLVKPA